MQVSAQPKPGYYPVWYPARSVQMYASEVPPVGAYLLGEPEVTMTGYASSMPFPTGLPQIGLTSADIPGTWRFSIQQPTVTPPTTAEEQESLRNAELERRRENFSTEAEWELELARLTAEQKQRAMTTAEELAQQSAMAGRTESYLAGSRNMRYYLVRMPGKEPEGQWLNDNEALSLGLDPVKDSTTPSAAASTVYGEEQAYYDKLRKEYDVLHPPTPTPSPEGGQGSSVALIVIAVIIIVAAWR